MRQEVAGTDRERPAGHGRARPPSVEAVLATVRPALGGHDAAAITALAREVVAAERERIGRGEAPREPAELGELVTARLARLSSAAGSGPVPVINATGVILHTNLGRAPWAEQAIAAAEAAARDYLLLELDPGTGRRGRRYRVAEEHLVALTGAEDALVVNNNAAAVALAVGLAGRRGVAVARGELVEIGGGVRIPEVIRRAGARLVEVGTTNRTSLADFAEVLASGRVAAVLRVHPSNFRQSGFVESPDPRAVADLAHAHGALVVDDLGSGALLDTAEFGLAHEPMPSERLADGSDVVTFSGDKLVGGPQAGLIVGRAALVARLRLDPLARAMRPDKTTLAALAATLALYRAGVARREIPTWRMIAADVADIRGRAGRLAATIRAHAVGEGLDADDAGGAGGPARDGGDGLVAVVPVESTVGGGSLPGEILPSWALALSVQSPDRVVAALRSGIPSVVARVAAGAVVFDLRTVRASDDEALAAAIRAALPGSSFAIGPVATDRPARRHPSRG